MSKYGVVIADEHRIIRRGVMSMVNGMSSMNSIHTGVDFSVVGEAATAPDLVRMISQNQVDLLFMGFSLAIEPGPAPLNNMDGISLIKWLCREHPELNIVVLSPYKNHNIIKQVLKSGAKGYLSRDTCEKTISRALAAVANGEVYVERQLMRSLFVQDKNNNAELSPRETDVLRMLCKGLTLSDISKMMHLSNKTVSAHKLRAMTKLGVSSDCQLYSLISTTKMFDISL